jgi:hypothetical protein
MLIYFDKKFRVSVALGFSAITNISSGWMKEQIVFSTSDKRFEGNV